jgi:hypothetical protein
MPLNVRTVVSVLLAGAAVTALHAQQPAAPALFGLSRDVACAPTSPLTRTAGSIKILRGTEARKTLFSPGEAVVIGGGAAQGMRSGDEYFVRRVVEDRYASPVRGVFPVTIHTAGSLRIVEVRGEVSTAVVTYACDGINEGDYVERFEPVALPETETGAAPDFTRPGHLILGAERRTMNATGAFMVIDRGTDHGLRVGQRLTIFRTTGGSDAPVTTVGTAKVYVVGPQTSTIRIEKSMDAVYVGDLIAIHR